MTHPVGVSDVHEVLLAELGETLRVERVLEVLEGQSVLKDVAAKPINHATQKGEVSHSRVRDGLLDEGCGLDHGGENGGGNCVLHFGWIDLVSSSGFSVEEYGGC